MNTSLKWLLLVAVFHTASAAQQLMPVHVLKIVAGPSGTEANGVFRLTEERSIFSRTADREILIFFQWENVPGPHKLVAQWRNSDGSSASSSTIDYNATEPRFGAYWRVPITSDMPLGTWSIDATMDGRPAGRLTFEVTDGKVAAAVVKRPLTPAELYERLNRLFVVLRRSATGGRELDPAAGFFANPTTGHIYTVVPALDAAESIRAVTFEGVTLPITQIVGLNRRQQWAVLQEAPGTGEALRVAPYETVAVGSQCFSIEGTAAGVRVLIGGTISGQVSTGGAKVMIASFARAVGMPGAPVVNEYGDLLGIVGAGLPGDPRPVDHIVEARVALGGAPIIPFPAAALPAGAVPSDLSAKRSAGILMSPLANTTLVTTALIARGPVKRGDTPPSLKEFSPRDDTMVLLVTWSPQRVRGTASMRVLDGENQVVGTSQPTKVNFNKGEFGRSQWDFPVPKSPGVYRVEVLLDMLIYWRGFFRVNP